MSSSIRLALILLAVALLCHCSDNPTKPNSPPVLSPVSSKSVEVGQTLAFTIMATDPDGTVPTIRAADLPTHADLTDGKDGTGLFSFVPDTSQAGQYDVVFVASDGELADSETVTIAVVEVLLPMNHAPVLTEIGSRTVKVGDTLTIILTATDPDSTIPTISAVDFPANSSFLTTDSGGSVFIFYPDTTQIGEHNVLFYATDGELADSETITIVVESVPLPENRAPVLLEIGFKTVHTGDTLRLTVSAADPDNTIPSLFAENLPGNSDFLPSGQGSSSFSFAPDTNQIGVYDILFYASDGELADSETVVILVNPAGNHRPVLIPIAPASCEATTSLSFIIAAVDSDGTIPTLTVYDLPPNAIFVDSANGRGGFAFNPDSTQIGVFEPIFVASDGEMADSESVQITVSTYVKSVGELLPMAVGNYWVYETSDQYPPIDWTLDSIYVQSSYESNGLTHWVLSGNGLWMLGHDLAIRNDTIFGAGGNPLELFHFSTRTDTVPAGTFGPVLSYCSNEIPMVSECLIFAERVGVIHYIYLWASPRDPVIRAYEARLLRYRVK